MSHYGRDKSWRAGGEMCFQMSFSSKEGYGAAVVVSMMVVVMMMVMMMMVLMTMITLMKKVMDRLVRDSKNTV